MLCIKFAEVLVIIVICEYYTKRYQKMTHLNFYRPLASGLSFALETSGKDPQYLRRWRASDPSWLKPVGAGMSHLAAAQKSVLFQSYLELS